MRRNDSPLLSDLRVLVVDCQATAASPGKGHLFEIAWADVGGDEEPAIECSRVALPTGQKIPTRDPADWADDDGPLRFTNSL